MAIKDLQKVQREFVLNAIFCTDYSEKSGEVDITSFLTTKGKLQHLANNFTTEAIYDYNLQRHRGNKTSILADHLQGLPSWLDIPFENYEILKLGKEWGYDLSTEKKEDTFCENYWNMIATKVMQLMDKYGVEVKKYSLDEIEFNDGCFQKFVNSKEDIEKKLSAELLKKISLVEHENATYVYANPDLTSKYGYDISYQFKDLIQLDRTIEDALNSLGLKNDTTINLKETFTEEYNNHLKLHKDTNYAHIKNQETIDNIALENTLKKHNLSICDYSKAIVTETIDMKNGYKKRKDSSSEEEALNKIVKQYEDNVFQGLNKEDLEFLGFKKERSLNLGDEYQIEYSKELEDKLKSFGYKKTWGDEGLVDSYAIFEVDNEDHEDYKKVFLSVRDNPILAPTLVNNKGVEEKPLRVHKVSQEEHYDTEDKRINKEIKKNKQR